MRRALAAALAALLVSVAAPARAHHVGTYTPADNATTANFKQVKFAVQARKFDVALRLFEGGVLRAEMRAQAAKLPPGAEAATRAALRAGDAAEVERLLMLLFVVLARDLALEGERALGAPGAVERRAATGRRVLEAIWRYYNLVDFAVSQRQPTAATAMRLAFDDAESYARGTAAPAAVNPCAGARRAGASAPDPDRLRHALGRIAGILTSVIEASSTPTRRDS